MPAGAEWSRLETPRDHRPHRAAALRSGRSRPAAAPQDDYLNKGGQIMTTISKAVLEPILKYMRDTPVDDWPLSFVVSPENMVKTITARRRVLARENTLTDEDSQRAVVILSTPDIEKPVMLMTDEVIAKCGSMYLKNKISRFRQILKDEDDRARDV